MKKGTHLYSQDSFIASNQIEFPRLVTKQSHGGGAVTLAAALEDCSTGQGLFARGLILKQRREIVSIEGHSVEEISTPFMLFLRLV